MNELRKKVESLLFASSLSVTSFAAESIAKVGDEIIDSTPGTDQEKGTGLGLQLCSDLIRINKGSISIASELNRGTTITIMLPAPSLRS